MLLQEIKVEDKVLKIYQDEDSESPREWDNFGHMICLHSRYTLGDKTDLSKDSFSSWEELEEYLVNEGAEVILPIYMYEHGCITISTDSFSSSWDSGQIGFIYCTREDIKNGSFTKEWLGKYHKGKSMEEVLKTILKGEVEVYDQYLRGEVYGYDYSKIVKCNLGHEHEETIDSCCGFIGREHLLDSLKESDIERELTARLSIYLDNPNIKARHEDIRTFS